MVKDFLKIHMYDVHWIFFIHMLIDNPVELQQVGAEVSHYRSHVFPFLANCVHPLLWDIIFYGRLLVTGGGMVVHESAAPSTYSGLYL